jgi:2-polyprenyl-3-methyl-5-hydroxy-6-metoxy-1,4-benzoquinol methylase
LSEQISNNIYALHSNMIFEFIRKLTCNFDEIEKYVPKKGYILDVGCGHGIFSKLLVDRSDKRSILGIDPSSLKISLAKKNLGKVPGLKFQKIHLEKIRQKFDSVVVVDVIYLFPNKEKIKFIRVVKNKLKDNGKLILVINGRKPKWMYQLLIIQERIMHKVLRITYSEYGKTYFESKEEAVDILKKAGLKIQKIVNIRSLLPYPHLLFVAAKK